MLLQEATEADHGEICALLATAGLPTSDIDPELCPSFVAIKAGGKILATGAVQRVGDDGLLRSVVVDAAFRSQGHGKQIVTALEARARAAGMHALFLLTTSSESFFARMGYRPIDRNDAPASIRETQQFAKLCPASSILMAKTFDKPFNVLFLCTHNSARSIMAEALLNALGRGRFHAYSAGSSPGAAPNPFALETIAGLKFPTEGLRSKAWDEYAAPGAPRMDFVITVCDNAAGEVCPVWPGQPITAHWGVDDPSLFPGSDEQKRRRFAQVAAVLKRRIELLLSLPLATLERLALQKKVRDIGRT
jgi:arsenate reductase